MKEKETEGAVVKFARAISENATWDEDSENENTMCRWCMQIPGLEGHGEDCVLVEARAMLARQEEVSR